MAAGEEYAPVEDSVRQTFTPDTFDRFTAMADTATGTNITEYNGDDVDESTLRTWADHGFVELERDNGGITGYGFTIRGYLAAEQDPDLVNGTPESVMNRPSASQQAMLERAAGYNGEAVRFLHTYTEQDGRQQDTASGSQGASLPDAFLEEYDLETFLTVAAGLSDNPTQSTVAEYLDVSQRTASTRITELEDNRVIAATGHGSYLIDSAAKAVLQAHTAEYGIDLDDLQFGDAALVDALELDGFNVNRLDEYLDRFEQGENVSEAADSLDVSYHNALRIKEQLVENNLVARDGHNYTGTFLAYALLQDESALLSTDETQALSDQDAPDPAVTADESEEDYQITDNVNIDEFVTFIETLGAGEPRSEVASSLDKSTQTIANWYGELKQANLLTHTGTATGTTYFLLPETRNVLETYADEHDLDPDAFHYLDPSEEIEQVQQAAAVAHLLNMDIPNIDVYAEELELGEYADNIGELQERFLADVDDAVPRAKLLQQYTEQESAADDGSLTFEDVTPDGYPDDLVPFRQLWDDLLAFIACDATDRGPDGAADLLDASTSGVESRLQLLESNDLVRYLPDSDGPDFYFDTDVRRAIQQYGLDIDGFDPDAVTYQDFAESDPEAKHVIDEVFDSEEELENLLWFAEVTGPNYPSQHRDSETPTRKRVLQRAARRSDMDYEEVESRFEELADADLIGIDTSEERFVFDDSLDVVLEDHGYDTDDRYAFRDVEAFRENQTGAAHESNFVKTADGDITKRDQGPQWRNSWKTIENRNIDKRVHHDRPSQPDTHAPISSDARIAEAPDQNNRYGTPTVRDEVTSLTPFEDLSADEMKAGILFEPGVDDQDRIYDALTDAIDAAPTHSKNTFLEQANETLDDVLEDDLNVYLTLPTPFTKSKMSFPIGGGQEFSYPRAEYNQLINELGHVTRDDRPVMAFEYKSKVADSGMPEAEDIIAHVKA